jgi:hypothetical protein
MSQFLFTRTDPLSTAKPHVVWEMHTGMHKSASPYVLRGFSAGYGASHCISTSSRSARLRHAEELLAVGRASSLSRWGKDPFQTLPNSDEDVLVLEDVIGLLPTANFRQWS